MMNISLAQYQPLYNKIPNNTEAPNLESEALNKNGVLVASHVSRPAYAYFRVKKDAIRRPCIIICPGGGYSIVAAIHEGTDVAKYLNSIGYNAIVLKYRIPDSANQPNPSIAPLQDVQQAMYLTRKNSDQWGIIPDQIGILGFSAGGHLASSLATHYSDVKIDNPEQISLRPDFQVLIYPVISFTESAHAGSVKHLLGSDASEQQKWYFSNERQVNSNTPPAFIVHSKADSTVPVKNAVVYDEALRHFKVPSFLYLFEKGKHGFGMYNEQSTQQWPALLETWLIQLQKP